MTNFDDIRFRADEIRELADKAQESEDLLATELAQNQADLAEVNTELETYKARVAELESITEYPDFGAAQDRTTAEYWTVKDKNYVSFDRGYMSAAMVAFKTDGIDLTIKKRATPITTGDGVSRSWDTPWLYLKPEYFFKYGRIEVEATLPTRENAPQGMWPAFWGMAQGGVGKAEVDLMESWYPPYSATKPAYQLGTTTSTTHIYDAAGKHYQYGTTCEETENGVVTQRVPTGHATWGTKHKWAVEKKPGVMTFYFDDKVVRTFTKESHPALFAAGFNFENPYDFRLCIAVGNVSYWLKNPVTTTTEVPKTMKIHKVTYWPLKGE